MADWRLDILSTRAEEARIWRHAVEGLPETARDVYYLPEFARIVENGPEEPVFLVRYGNAENYLLNIFTRRGTSDLPFCNGSERGFADIVTPYGYGGPAMKCADEGIRRELISGYHEAFGAHCVSQGIVAEFDRLHPLIGNHRYLSEHPGLVRNNATVWIDLMQSPEAIWRDIRKGHKSSIKKAMRSGVEIRRSERREDLEAFHRLYIVTMERNCAIGFYMFPLEYFEKTLSYLGRHASLFVARWNGKVVGASLFIHFGRYLHYHFSGMDDRYGDLCANHLLLYQVALWGRSEGYRVFHLGGGHACREDSLFRFKTGFSKSRAPYYMLRQVHDRTGYDYLCGLKQQYEKETKAADGPKDPVLVDYFPAYRA